MIGSIRKLTSGSALAALTLTGLAAAPASAEEAGIFFMLPNSTTIRFERRDAPLYVAAMKKRMPDATVTVQNAEGDPERQQRLVEDALAQGADLIVYTSSDANLAAGALKAAEEAGVPVLLYEHDAIGGQAEAHVLFNARAVGQAQGKRAAELIEAMPDDTVRIARVKGNQGEYGTTGGAVAALISQGYDKGEIVVTGGQDATIEALQFIVQGWQDNTVFKDLRVMAEAAADLSVDILNGEPLSDQWINGEVNNEFKDVPAAFLPVNNVTADNVADVVNAGIYSWAEICKGAEDTELCKANL